MYDRTKPFQYFVGRMCTCVGWGLGYEKNSDRNPAHVRGVILQTGSLVSQVFVMAHVGHAGVPILFSMSSAAAV